jgi:hypothetical protein
MAVCGACGMCVKSYLLFDSLDQVNLTFMPMLRTLFFQIKLTAQEEVALELRASQV